MYTARANAIHFCTECKKKKTNHNNEGDYGQDV